MLIGFKNRNIFSVSVERALEIGSLFPETLKLRNLVLGPFSGKHPVIYELVACTWVLLLSFTRALGSNGACRLVLYIYVRYIL